MLYFHISLNLTWRLQLKYGKICNQSIVIRGIGRHNIRAYTSLRIWCREKQLSINTLKTVVILPRVFNNVTFFVEAREDELFLTGSLLEIWRWTIWKELGIKPKLHASIIREVEDYTANSRRTTSLICPETLCPKYGVEKNLSHIAERSGKMSIESRWSKNWNW